MSSIKDGLRRRTFNLRELDTPYLNNPGQVGSYFGGRRMPNAKPLASGAGDVAGRRSAADDEGPGTRSTVAQRSRVSLNSDDGAIGDFDPSEQPGP
jgi:hypothetical protein